MSPLDPAFWTGPALVALRIALIAVGAWVAAVVLRRMIRLFRERIVRRLDDPEQVKRADTIGRVFRYMVTVVMALMAGMLVLSELGISVAPILGAAGVVGLAVGFGAQSLVKDYFTGFFLLLENQIRAGRRGRDRRQIRPGRGGHAALRAAARLRRQRALRAQQPDHHGDQHEPRLRAGGRRRRRRLPRGHRPRHAR